MIWGRFQLYHLSTLAAAKLRSLPLWYINQNKKGNSVIIITIMQLWCIIKWIKTTWSSCNQNIIVVRSSACIWYVRSPELKSGRCCFNFNLFVTQKMLESRPMTNDFHLIWKVAFSSAEKLNVEFEMSILLKCKKMNSSLKVFQRRNSIDWYFSF